MDVFKIELEQSQIGKSLVEKPKSGCAPNAGASKAGQTNTEDDNEEEDDEDEEQIILPEVSFDANSDFNLHFFDTPEDSSTQGGCSEANSVESETIFNDDEQSTLPTTTEHINNNQLDFIVELGAVLDEEQERETNTPKHHGTYYANDINITATTTTTTATTTSSATISFALDRKITTTTSTAHIGELSTVQAIVDDITAYQQHNHQQKQHQRQQQQQQQQQQLPLSSASSSSSSSSYSSSSSCTSSCSSNCSSLSPTSAANTQLCNSRESAAALNTFLPNSSGNSSLNFVSTSYSNNNNNQFNPRQYNSVTPSAVSSTVVRVNSNNKTHLSGICATGQLGNYIANGHDTSTAVTSSSSTSLANTKVQRQQQQQQQQQPQQQQNQHHQQHHQQQQHPQQTHHQQGR